MVTIDQAIETIRKNLPDGTINAFITWGDNYLFSVYTSDPDEGELDPFYAVNIETGLFSGFSIVGDEDTTGILEAFEAKIQHTDLAHSFLDHHGVKGMKWGVRNAGKSMAKPRPSQASVNAEAVLNVTKPILSMVVPRATVSSKAIMLGQAALNKVDMTVALKAASISPMAIAGYAVTALDTGAYRIPSVATQNAIRGGWNKNAALANPKLSASDIQKKVVSGINKDFPGLGTTNNCLRSTYAYEMRRRGFDVAATKTIFASGQTGIGTHIMTKTLHGASRIKDANHPIGIKGHITHQKPSSTDVFRELSKQPDRSRGDLQMHWGFLMGGHSVAYEIINKKPVIFDTQSGKSYSTPSELNALTKRAQGMSFNRLDNKNINETGITAWVKDNK